MEAVVASAIAAAEASGDVTAAAAAASKKRSREPRGAVGGEAKEEEEEVEVEVDDDDDVDEELDTSNSSRLDLPFALSASAERIALILDQATLLLSDSDAPDCERRDSSVGREQEAGGKGVTMRHRLVDDDDVDVGIIDPWSAELAARTRMVEVDFDLLG